jgi:hypothetical protein
VEALAVAFPSDVTELHIYFRKPRRSFLIGESVVDGPIAALRQSRARLPQHSTLTAVRTGSLNSLGQDPR